MLLFGRRKRHRRDQGRTVCGCPATVVRPSAAVTWRIREIEDQQPPGGRAFMRADQRPRLLLQAEALEQADDRQHDPDDRDDAILVERLAEGRDDLDERSMPPSSPVTIAEPVTTSIGLSRSAKPRTTSAIPSSGQ